MAKYKIRTTDSIMAIDPGVDCGFATWYPNNGKIVSWQTRPTHDEFIQTLNEFYPDVIVIEQFDHRQKSNTNYAPVEFIGLTKWYVERRRLPLIMQTPSMGKGYFSKEKLQHLDLYKPGKDHEDEMMALRHLLQAMMNSGLLDLKTFKTA